MYKYTYFDDVLWPSQGVCYRVYYNFSFSFPFVSSLPPPPFFSLSLSLFLSLSLSLSLSHTHTHTQNYGHPASLFEEGISQLNDLLTSLSPFLESPEKAGGSALFAEIGELSNLSTALQSPTSLPLLHNLVSVNAFIMMFIHLCKASQVGYNVSVCVVCVCVSSFIHLDIPPQVVYMYTVTSSL